MPRASKGPPSRGGGYRSTRMPKAVEKHRVSQFIEVVADVKKRHKLEQVWFDLEDFKSAVYGVANGKITGGRSETLDRLTGMKDLTYIYNPDRTRIGFVGYTETNDAISTRAMDSFYKKAGRDDW